MDSRLFWLALAAFVGSTEGGLVSGLLPSIAEDMNVTAGQTGQLVMGYSLAYAIGTPVLSALLGGVARRRVLAGGQLTLAVCALLIAVSPFFAWMVGARTLLAIGAGLFTATALATAAMIAPPGQRGRALQVVSMGQSLAALLGVPLGAYVATHYNWRLDYFAVSIAAFAAAVALYLKVPKGLHGDTQTLGDRVRVLGNRGVVPALLTTLLSAVATSFPVVFVGALVASAGLGREVLPVPLFASGVGAVLASATAGRLADRLGNRTAVISACTAVIAVLAAYLLLPYLPTTARLVLLFCLYGSLSYVAWGYWIAHCSEMAHLAPNSVPVAISLNLTAFNMGVAIAAGVGGAIVDGWGADALAYASVPLALVALGLAIATPTRTA
ncbi:MAG: MFS transporter [Devosia sp.]|uniref:MFS transporter n=1 Tax=Devosia sp. TaxID=1871048 RepID=UPI001A4679EE|nr:MFS transporter [Devosia sp.]MBL8596629.1 MFS transporter [Devosia sp.]